MYVHALNEPVLCIYRYEVVDYYTYSTGTSACTMLPVESDVIALHMQEKLCGVRAHGLASQNPN